MYVNAAAGLLLASVLFTSVTPEPFGSEQRSGTERPTAQLQPRRAAAGAASVAGTVVNDEGGPLSRARVTLRSALLPEPRVLVTDGMGRFSFDRLPAGDYRGRARGATARMARSSRYSRQTFQRRRQRRSYARSHRH